MERFIVEEQGKYIIIENEDHCDNEGNWGMSSKTIAEFNSKEEAEANLNR